MDPQNPKKKYFEVRTVKSGHLMQDESRHKNYGSYGMVASREIFYMGIEGVKKDFSIFIEFAKPLNAKKIE